MSETGGHESSPEPSLSELCVKLEDKFTNVHDLSKAEAMRVYARIRPMLDSEIKAEFKECVGVVDDQIVRAVFPASSAKYKISSHLSQDIIEDFTFTAAYGPEAGQFVFFESCMMDTMQNFIEGQNSLVFSYGTTGSGKTFTLQGNPDSPGIIPLSLHLFFASIEDQLLDKILVKPDKFADVIVLNDADVKRELEIKEKLLSTSDQEEWSISNSSKSFAMMLCDNFSEKFETQGRQTTLCPEEMAQAQAASLMREVSRKSAEEQPGCCSVWVSFVEIYNENIYDLLQPNVSQRAKLNLGEDKNGDVYVKGLREICVSSSYEALKLLNFGQRNLKIASTKLNYQSSRSHCIFTVKVIRIPDPVTLTHVKVNRLSFCDLAGSERAAKSQTTGMRLKEAGCINTSLLVLGRCLEQLRLKPSLRDKKLIPFRESKVTRLFSGFFTGRGKAMMITNASPSELTFDETLHALRFSAIAKELIINDSYIATASSTLQSITSMWTNARSNCKDNSSLSDKSISFEDSMDEVIQEKDELIEKLLDLAESLRNNLEREKKERAELEMKIRQDVCDEYSTYSDELLASQKIAFDEEREAIKEIYQKRISAMEKMYENIIKDYNIQLEENDSSTDETCDDFEIKQSQNPVRQPEDVKDGIKNEITEFETESSNLVNLSEESERSKEEFQKTVEYSLSLEAELECFKKKFEDAQLELENAMKMNHDLKEELDAYKIDYVAYKTDNANLLKEKSAVEDDVKLLSEDLAALSQDRATISEKLAKSECHLLSQSEEMKNLLQNINELLRIHEESTIKYEKSLEQANSEVSKVKDELLATSQKLTEEKNNRCKLESVITSMEVKICELKSAEQNYIEANKTIETMSKEIEDVREENTKLRERLDAANLSAANYCQATLDLKDEIQKLRESHSENIKELNDSIKQHETDSKEAEKILKSVHETLDNALSVIEQQKKKVENLEAECTSCKNEALLLLNEKKYLEKKLESALENFDAENKKNHLDLNDESAKMIEELTSKCDNMKSDCLKQKEKMDALCQTNITLEENIASLSKELESERKTFTEQIDALTKRLEEAVLTIDSQKNELENLLLENKCHKSEIKELHDVNKELEEKANSYASQSESEKECANKELDKMKSKLGEALNMVDEQKKEIETLLNEINSSKSELAELRNLNKELEDNLNIKNESEKECINKELDEMKSKLDEALNMVDKQKKEIETLLNEINSSKSELAELRNLNKELEDNLNIKNESEKECTNKELDETKTKLDEALNMVDKQKKEIETLLNEINSSKSELAELRNLNKELEENLNLKNVTEVEKLANIDQLAKELQEAELTINKQKSEIENLNIKSELDVKNLLDLNRTVQEKLNSQVAQCEILSELVKVLEHCEVEATNKAKDLLDEVDKLKASHSEEFTPFLHLIELLEKCELISSDKIKEFHTRAIKSVEQIMDLEACIKAKEKAIADKTNDYNALQKQLKELQASSKKQLVAEKQQHTSMIDTMKKEMSATQKEVVSQSQKIAKLQNELSKLEKENGRINDEKNTLKTEVGKLEKVKEKFESAVKTLEKDIEKLVIEKGEIQSACTILQRENERLFKEKEKLEKDNVEYKDKALNSEKKNTKVETVKQEEKENDGQSTGRAIKSSRNAKRSSSGKRSLTEKNATKPQCETLANRKISAEKESSSQKIELDSDATENIVKAGGTSKNQGEKRKNKATVTKSSAAAKTKKQKSKVYEETDEDINTENNNVENRSSRRQLRCMENEELNLMENNNRNFTKSRAQKRKEIAEDDEVSDEKLTLKKLKLHEPSGIENISKPQNLRIKLLKATIAVNDIPAPSPRMTRGRKRLVKAKENMAGNKASPRSLRS